MSRPPSRGLFAHVQSYFTEYLPRQRGASAHTIRAYRDALTLLLRFVADQRGRGLDALQLSDLDADAVTRFLDHIEVERSNSPITRNCRRAAIRGFFKHLLRNDMAHSLQYMRVLAIPAKKARQRPATYLEAEEVPTDHRHARPAHARRMARLHAAAVPLQLRCTGQRGGRASMGRVASDGTKAGPAAR
jgi:site-specific recombinase XerD